MTFTHCNFLGDLELEKKETPGCRLYHLPDGQWVPSITSVTSFIIVRSLLTGVRELVLRKQIELQRKQLLVELISMKQHKHI